MRKKKKAELQNLLFRKTGIDFTKYEGEELLDTITNLVLFPRYAFSVILKPVFILSFLTIVVAIALFVLSMQYWGIVTFLIGFFVAIFIGLSIGNLFFAERLRGDFKHIISFSVETTKQILKDMQGKDIPEHEKKLDLPSIWDIVNGVWFLVILPALKKVIQKKIPLVGGIVNFFVERFFDIFAKRVKRKLLEAEKDEPALTPNQPTTVSKIPAKQLNVMGIQIEVPTAESKMTVWQKYCQRGIESMDKYQGIFDRVIRVAMNVTAAPFWILLMINTGFTTFFILLATAFA